MTVLNLVQNVGKDGLIGAVGKSFRGGASRRQRQSLSFPGNREVRARLPIMNDISWVSQAYLGLQRVARRCPPAE